MASALEQSEQGDAGRERQQRSRFRQRADVCLHGLARHAPPGAVRGVGRRRDSGLRDAGARVEHPGAPVVERIVCESRDRFREDYARRRGNDLGPGRRHIARAGDVAEEHARRAGFDLEHDAAACAAPRNRRRLPPAW